MTFACLQLCDGDRSDGVEFRSQHDDRVRFEHAYHGLWIELYLGHGHGFAQHKHTHTHTRLEWEGEWAQGATTRLVQEAGIQGQAETEMRMIMLKGMTGQGNNNPLIKFYEADPVIRT